MAMTKIVTPIADQEETPKVTNATKRSSPVGRASNRLFIRDNAQRSTSEASVLGPGILEAPLGSPQRAGRGRALPQLSLSNTPSPSDETKPRETSPHPSNYSYSNINPVKQQRESFERNMGGYCRNPLLNMIVSPAPPWPHLKPWRR